MSREEKKKEGNRRKEKGEEIRREVRDSAGIGFKIESHGERKGRKTL